MRPKGHQSKSEYDIQPRDIRQAIEAVEELMGGHTQVSITTDTVSGAKSTLRIVCSYLLFDISSLAYPVCEAEQLVPSGRFKTVPGAMLDTLIVLYGQVEKLKKVCAAAEKEYARLAQLDQSELN